jgi:hypothetical protein
MELPLTRLPEERLARIEEGARQRGTLGDRVTCELVEEVRRLRAFIAEGDPFPG